MMRPDLALAVALPTTTLQFSDWQASVPTNMLQPLSSLYYSLTLNSIPGNIGSQTQSIIFSSRPQLVLMTGCPHPQLSCRTTSTSSKCRRWRRDVRQESPKATKANRVSRPTLNSTMLLVSLFALAKWYTKAYVPVS